MSDARARGWGNPDAANYQRDHIIAVRAGGIVLYVRREIAYLVIGFVDEIVQRGYRLDVRADDWGYNNRDIRGRPGVKSNHAWGLAIDLNSATNPMTEDGHVHTDMPAWVPETAAKYGLFWGGHYSGSRKDPMHYEFLGTPADVAQYPRGGANPAPPPPSQPTEDEDMAHRYGANAGDDKSEVLVDGPIAIIIKHPDSAEALDGGNVKTIFINPEDYDDLKKQASNP